MNSPLPVFLHSPKAWAYSRDGQTWPAETGGVLIPSGHHRVLAAGALSLRMLTAQSSQFQSLSCDLLDANVLSTGLVLRYTSPGRAAIVLTQRPEEILVDGQRTGIPVDGRGDEWVILAPRGEHRLEITTLTRAGLAINWSSWILSSVIVAFGASATLLMLWLYIRLRVNPAVRWRRSEG